MPSMLRAVLAVLAGAALSLAFAPFELWWLAPVCLGCLYSLIQPSTPKRAAFLGFLFGLGFFGVSVSWVYNSLHVFGGAALPVALALTAVFVCVMACFPAVTAYTFRKLTHQQAARMKAFNALLFAGLWVVAELARGKIMGGFPWVLIGYSQTSGPLGSFAPVVGVYGISFLVVFWSVLLTTLAVPKQALITRISSAVWLVLIPVVSIALNTVAFSTPTGEEFKVRIVQANIAQELKFSRERLQQSIQEYTALTVDAPEGTQLVVWPETAIPTYFSNVERVIAPWVKEMDARGIDVLSGGFYSDDTGNYNAVRQLGGDQALYRKSHLVPFGEYVPFRFALKWFSSLVTIPNFDLSAGPLPLKPLMVQDIALGVSICYEDVFGEEMRALLPEATVLVNVSNDAWFGDSFAPHQHEQKARMRAREFSRPMVRSTNTGVSSFINERGEVSGRIPHDKQGVLDRTVLPQQGQTPYAATGNWPVGLLSFGVIAFAIGLQIYRRRV